MVTDRGVIQNTKFVISLSETVVVADVVARVFSRSINLAETVVISDTVLRGILNPIQAFGRVVIGAAGNVRVNNVSPTGRIRDS